MSSEPRLHLLFGPNRWASETVLEVYAGSSLVAQSGLLPKPAILRLERWLGAHDLLPDKAASLENASWAQQLGQLVASLRIFAGLEPPSFDSDSSGACLALRCDDHSFTTLCLEAAFALCRAAVSSGSEQAFETVLNEFAQHALDLGFDPPSIAVMQAARRLGVPFRRHSILHAHFVLGEGRNQILLDATDTNRTSAMAKAVAANKDLCNALLSAYGFPVPRQEVVEQAEEAWAAAQRVGLPAVIKPRRGNQGRGVALGVSNRSQAVAAFDAARQVCSEVLVEATLPGEDHRVLVVGRGIIALHRLVPTVRGDGVRTIGQLIEMENRHRLAQGRVLGAIQARADTVRLLEDAGRSLDSVPAAGEIQALQAIPNAAWPRRDVSAVVHPQNLRMLSEAARLIGLDIASIDFRTPDISRPWTETGGGICEVETQASLWALLRADVGLIDTFLHHLIVDRPLRIPQVLVIAGEDVAGAEGWAAVLAQECAAAFGWQPALLISAGMSIAGLQTSPSTPAAAQTRALEHPAVDIAISVATAASCRADGLGVERPTLVVLVDPDGARDLGEIAARAGARVLSWPERAQAAPLLGKFDPMAVRAQAAR